MFIIEVKRKRHNTFIVHSLIKHYAWWEHKHLICLGKERLKEKKKMKEKKTKKQKTSNYFINHPKKISL